MIEIYAGDPAEAPQPSWWHPFAQPGGSGANLLRQAIVGCVPGFGDVPYVIGEPILTEPGAQIGPIRMGFEEVIAADEYLEWDPDLNSIYGAGCPSRDGLMCTFNSPRVRPLLMYDPINPPDPGRKPMDISQIAGVYINRIEGGGTNLRVFVNFVNYTGVFPADEWSDDGGSFIKMLRIVE